MVSFGLLFISKLPTGISPDGRWVVASEWFAAGTSLVNPSNGQRISGPFHRRRRRRVADEALAALCSSRPRMVELVFAKQSSGVFV
jgi:hypothetical protein